MNSTPTAARPRYRACLLRPASTAAMIVATPHTSHTMMKTMLLCMAAPFGCAHFNRTSGWPGREEANVLAHEIPWSRPPLAAACAHVGSPGRVVTPGRPALRAAQHARAATPIGSAWQLVSGLTHGNVTLRGKERATSIGRRPQTHCSRPLIALPAGLTSTREADRRVSRRIREAGSRARTADRSQRHGCGHHQPRCANPTPGAAPSFQPRAVGRCQASRAIRVAAPTTAVVTAAKSRCSRPVLALVATPGGRVVSGDDSGARVWNPGRPDHERPAPGSAPPARRAAAPDLRPSAARRIGRHVQLVNVMVAGQHCRYEVGTYIHAARCTVYHAVTQV